MSQWTALTGDKFANAFRIAYLIPIPNTNNRSGVNYRTAIINSGIGGKTVRADGDGTGGTISAADKSSITSGAAYEYVEDFATNPSLNVSQLAAAVDARFTALTTIIQNELANQLQYFGGKSVS